MPFKLIHFFQIWRNKPELLLLGYLIRKVRGCPKHVEIQGENPLLIWFSRLVLKTPAWCADIGITQNSS
jgi:hypothetical protein